MIIYQGNTYKLPISLKIGDKTITDNDVKMVEFSFGNINKKYPDNVEFEDGSFIVSLSQEETFSFLPMAIYNFQARILFNDGSVKRTEPAEFTIVASQSKEVLV